MMAYNKVNKYVALVRKIVRLESQLEAKTSLLEKYRGELADLNLTKEEVREQLDILSEKTKVLSGFED